MRTGPVAAQTILGGLYRRFVRPVVHSLFFTDLVRTTANFGELKWLGQPIWQNVLDLWVIQETLAEVKPELLIECGTNKGGSALFYAHLFDLMGRGNVVTIDVEPKHDVAHVPVTYLVGSSTSPAIVHAVRERVAACHGPVLVILDSSHSSHHVRAELRCYAPFVTRGSYCLVQDGIIDTLRVFRAGRPGPLPAIEDFLQTTNDFVIDEERSKRFLISHHPKGWLKR